MVTISKVQWVNGIQGVYIDGVWKKLSDLNQETWNWVQLNPYGGVYSGSLSGVITDYGRTEEQATWTQEWIAEREPGDVVYSDPVTGQQYVEPGYLSTVPPSEYEAYVAEKFATWNNVRIWILNQHEAGIDYPLTYNDMVSAYMKENPVALQAYMKQYYPGNMGIQLWGTFWQNLYGVWSAKEDWVDTSEVVSEQGMPLSERVPDTADPNYAVWLDQMSVLQLQVDNIKRQLSLLGDDSSDELVMELANRISELTGAVKVMPGPAPDPFVVQKISSVERLIEEMRGTIGNLSGVLGDVPTLDEVTGTIRSTYGDVEELIYNEAIEKANVILDNTLRNLPTTQIVNNIIAGIKSAYEPIDSEEFNKLVDNVSKVANVLQMGLVSYGIGKIAFDQATEDFNLKLTEFRTLLNLFNTAASNSQYFGPYSGRSSVWSYSTTPGSGFIKSKYGDYYIRKNLG